MEIQKEVATERGDKLEKKDLKVVTSYPGPPRHQLNFFQLFRRQRYSQRKWEIYPENVNIGRVNFNLTTEDYNTLMYFFNVFSTSLPPQYLNLY